MCNNNSNNNNIYNNSYTNMQTNNDMIIENAQALPFSRIIANVGFTYSNGTFIANKSGTYLVVYHINIEGSLSTTDITIDLLKNGIKYQTIEGNALVGQFSGSTALKLNVGDTIQLVNSTGEEIEITFANITIYGT